VFEKDSLSMTIHASQFHETNISTVLSLQYMQSTWANRRSLSVQNCLKNRPQW